MMGGIKAGSTKVSDGPRFAPDAAHPVLRAQGVAIVLNQPQAVFIAESSHHGQIKGTAQRMRQNDGPCPVRSGLFQEGHVHIAVRELYIHKHRLQAALDDGSNRGGEPGGNREDLIPRLSCRSPSSGDVSADTASKLAADPEQTREQNGIPR